MIIIVIILRKGFTDDKNKASLKSNESHLPCDSINR